MDDSRITRAPLPQNPWHALAVLCAGSLMIVLDGTIVNVALPAIRADLGFTPTTLVWVVNAYLLTFGGFLLLGGRLGDLFGRRKLFLYGIALFTLASLFCGIANSPEMLIAGRAIQGIGGAVVSAVTLSLVTTMFTEDAERAKAMGVFGFVQAGGSSIGSILGGVLTTGLNWHWIFLVNLPIGVITAFAAFRFVARDTGNTAARRLDAAGAITITASLMLAVYAIVGGNDAGWLTQTTLTPLILAIALFAGFIAIEGRMRSPLVPLRFFRSRTIVVTNAIGILWAAGMFAWFFVSALYLQTILHFTSLQVGLAFVPSSIIMAFFSLGASAKLIERFGLRKPLAAGLTLAGAGLLCFAGAPVDGTFLRDVLPGMVLLGFGAGIAFNPVLMAAMSDVAPEEAGIASGIVNTSFMMGGALGLAILAAVAAAHTHALTALGADPISALNGGYQRTFAAGSLLAFAGALVGGIFLKEAPVPNAVKT